MAIDRQADFNLKTTIRLIYDDNYNVIQIRTMKPNSKIGERLLDIDNLYYDNNYNLTHILYDEKTIESNDKQVNNLDIMVPEQPVIVSIDSTNPIKPIIIGICGTGAIGEIVKNNDVVDIMNATNKLVLNSGLISSNNFSIQIDLTDYTESSITLTAQARNDRFKVHGGSKLAIEYIYTI